jgi:cyanophycin synthetase
MSVLLRSVVADGAGVLNADDEWTVGMANAVQGEAIYFSLEEQNPVIQDHLRSRGRAVTMRQTPSGEMLTLLEGANATNLLLAGEMRITTGKPSQLAIQCAMAAAAAAIAQNVAVEDIRTALRSFTIHEI